MRDRKNLTPPIIARFWAKVRKSSGCWNWTAATAHFGHGQFWFPWRGKCGTMVEAHRVSWLINRGEVPKGKCVLHTCDNPACVRLSHLYIGTKKQNAIDRRDRKRHWRDRNPVAFAAHQQRISILGNRASQEARSGR